MVLQVFAWGDDPSFRTIFLYAEELQEARKADRK